MKAAGLVGLAGLVLPLSGCEATCIWPRWEALTTENTDGGLVSNTVTTIALDSAGGKWVGTSDDWGGSWGWGGGVSHLSADNTTWTTFTPANTDGGLVDDRVLAIAIDSDGGKWVGTHEGVSHLSADNNTWTTYTAENTGGGLVSNSVYAIAIDSAGGKWFGTYGGVSHLSADNTTWTQYTYANTNGGLVDNSVKAIALDSAGGKWFGTDGGVSHLSADNTTWARFTYDRTTFTYEDTDGGIAPGDVQAVAIDNAGGKWFGVNGLNLSHLSADNTSWTTFTTRNTDGGLAPGSVRAIAIDSAGGKWFATGHWSYNANAYVGGVSHLSADNTTWATVMGANVCSGLSGTVSSPRGKWLGGRRHGSRSVVTAIAIDSAGGKWVGTSGGLFYWTAAFGM